MSVRCHYFNSKPNFGDRLTPIIIKWISGHTTEYVHGNEEGKLLAIGSDMNLWLRKNDVVWGYGSRDTDKHGKIIVPDGVRFRAVRGMMTRENILKDNPEIEVPEIYGDPAMLMPLIYKKPMLIRYCIGVIPHYIDRTKFNLKDRRIKVINVFDDPYKVIDEIRSCEIIVSTSLHGLIVAEAYGKHTVWLKVSDRILGAWFKFNDYFSATGRGLYNPVEIKKETITVRDIVKVTERFLPVPTYDTEPLIKAWWWFD